MQEGPSELGSYSYNLKLAWTININSMELSLLGTETRERVDKRNKAVVVNVGRKRIIREFAQSRSMGLRPREWQRSFEVGGDSSALKP